jgi:hypothetical protein
MISENYKKKVPCTKCGEQCYRLCYVGKRVVCVDCFRFVCEKAENKGNIDK